MTGVKGRSGKISNPESRKLRRAAAAAGGQAFAGRGKADAPEPVEGLPDHAPALLAAFPELRGYPFSVRDSLALKDALDAALKQAKARQAEVELEEAKAKLAQAAGRLVPIAELHKLAPLLRDAWWREVQQVVPLVLLRLPDLPTELRARIKDAIAAEVLAAAERVKRDLSA
ncbi:MAG: hypothetical protein RLZZ524_608 [Pseudomonadota bacterium]|jgi:hypothetical protein